MKQEFGILQSEFLPKKYGETKYKQKKYYQFRILY